MTEVLAMHPSNVDDSAACQSVACLHLGLSHIVQKRLVYVHTLDDKAFDDSVEVGALVAKTLLASGCMSTHVLLATQRCQKQWLTTLHIKTKCNLLWSQDW